MAERTTTVRLENKAAHMKFISLPGGNTVTVPPTEGAAGITLTLESDIEREQFDKALESAAVKQWLDAGELVVHRDAAVAGDAPVKLTPAEQVQQTQQTAREQGKKAPNVDAAALDAEPATHSTQRHSRRGEPTRE